MPKGPSFPPLVGADIDRQAVSRMGIEMRGLGPSLVRIYDQITGLDFADIRDVELTVRQSTGGHGCQAHMRFFSQPGNGTVTYEVTLDLHDFLFLAEMGKSFQEYHAVLIKPEDGLPQNVGGYCIAPTPEMEMQVTTHMLLPPSR